MNWRHVSYNWRLYGLPRCAGWMGPNSDCSRLLWPWFEIGGNGEDAMCLDCTDALHMRYEMEDNAGRDSASFPTLDEVMG